MTQVTKIHLSKKKKVTKIQKKINQLMYIGPSAK